MRFLSQRSSSKQAVVGPPVSSPASPVPASPGTPGSQTSSFLKTNGKKKQLSMTEKNLMKQDCEPAPLSPPTSPKPFSMRAFGVGRKERIDTERSHGAEAPSFRVQIPDGVQPGEEFEVKVGDRSVVVKCPMSSGAHSKKFFTLRLPEEHTSSSSDNDKDSEEAYTSPGIKKLLQPDSKGRDVYLVTIPDGISGGQFFDVTIDGRNMTIKCPPAGLPGMRVRVVPPPAPKDRGATTTTTTTNTSSPKPSQKPKPKPLIRRSSSNDIELQLFEVQVPNHVRPGRPFALLAGGMRVLVNCPIDAVPGQKIRFELPLALLQAGKDTSSTAAQRLTYDKDGWSRTIRLYDQQFQWVRLNEKGGVDGRHLKAGRFDPEKSAFCRKLVFVEGPDVRIREGILQLVPAHEAVCESKIRNKEGKTIVTYPDIAEAQGQNFSGKVKWFHGKCKELAIEYSDGYMRINVRRDFLLEDSVDAIMSLSRRDMLKTWRFEFIGEKALDAGGVSREWYHLVTSRLFDPDVGFWLPSETNQMCMGINPFANLFHPDYLVYYRFLGRVMGKALFDEYIVAGHMTQFIYKHMLGWPITFKDLKSFDEGYYTGLKNLKEYAESGGDVENVLCMDFTTTVDVLGSNEVVELVQNGSDIAVDNSNYLEFIEVCLKYHVFERIKPQLSELLLGFFDVIPEPLLTVFDFQELELLMCGLPMIDVNDWMENTLYAGLYEDLGEIHQSCQWFWEIVYEFDQEMKARLLQFVTGSAGVPSRGFGVLQGNDRTIRKFTIHGLLPEECIYPRAHTCFNRIDLPIYPTKAELREKLNFSVSMAATGFDIE